MEKQCRVYCYSVFFLRISQQRTLILMHTNLSLSNKIGAYIYKRLDKQRHESEVRRPGAGSEEAKNIRTCSNEGRTAHNHTHTQCHTHKNTQLRELVSSPLMELLLCKYWTDADLARLCITCKRISAPVQHLINVLMTRRIWRATDLEKLKLSPARLAYVRHAELNLLPSVFHDLSNLETLTCNGREWVTDLSALWSFFNLHT
jgi:hypothetical protein